MTLACRNWPASAFSEPIAVAKSSFISVHHVAAECGVALREPFIPGNAIDRFQRPAKQMSLHRRKVLAVRLRVGEHDIAGELGHLGCIILAFEITCRSCRWRTKVGSRSFPKPRELGAGPARQRDQLLPRALRDCRAGDGRNFSGRYPTPRQRRSAPTGRSTASAKAALRSQFGSPPAAHLCLR